MYFIGHQTERISNVDIKNAQPFILASILIKPQLIRTIAPEFSILIPILEEYSHFTDVKAFHLDCQQGRIYEYFMDSIRNSIKDSTKITDKEIRNIAKKKLIGFLYSNMKGHGNNSTKNYSKKRFKSEFNSLYPNVLKAIQEIKTITIPEINQFYTKNKKQVGTKTNLPCLCQRVESRILLGMIAPKLFKQGTWPLTSIHDSFIVREKDATLVEAVIVKTFEGLGLKPPMVKIELLQMF